MKAIEELKKEHLHLVDFIENNESRDCFPYVLGVIQSVVKSDDKAIDKISEIKEVLRLFEHLRNKRSGQNET